MTAAPLAACEYNAAPHFWWPRPDVGADVVRCSECAKESTESKLTPAERTQVFAVNLVRLFQASPRKRDDLGSWARGHWKVFAGKYPSEGQHERRFWDSLDAAAKAVLA